MTKILALIFISFLLFSCNELSDKEMEIRLTELELIKLANEHLEEDIDVLLMTVDKKMALATNKKKLNPITSKIWRIDSILISKIDYVVNSNDITTYIPIINLINDTILNRIDADTSFYLEFNEKTYYDSSKTYSFSHYHTDLLNLKLEITNLLRRINTPNEFELREIKTIIKSHFLLLRKRTLEYLIQIMSSSYFIITDQINISLEIENIRFKPNESFKIIFFPAVPYYTNNSILNYVIDDSIFKERMFFNKFSFDSIKIPTHSIGKHKITINQYQLSDSNNEYIFNYEVIEQK